MVEVEKVIRGLECCEHPYAKKCATCPYNSYTPDSMECTGYLCKDILALLKEQEPVKPRWTHPTESDDVWQLWNCDTFGQAELLPVVRKKGEME